MQFYRALPVAPSRSGRAECGTGVTGRWNRPFFVSPGGWRRRQQRPALPVGMDSVAGSGRRRVSAEVLEELGGRRIDHHHIALLAEARLVGFEAPVELGELGIATERIRIDARCLGIALPLQLLGITVRVGDGDLALPVGVCADLLAFGGTGGAEFVRHALALGFHAAIDRLGNGLDVIDAGDADIDDIHAPGLAALDDLQDFLLHVRHERVALGGQQLLDRAAVDLFLEGIADDPVQLQGAGVLVEADVADVLRRVGDAPAHVPVDHHALLFSGQHGLRVGAIQREQALVDVAHVLERRGQLEIEARLGDDFLDLPQLVHHAELALVHDEQRGAEQGEHHQQGGNDESDSVHDCLSLGLAGFTVPGAAGVARAGIDGKCLGGTGRYGRRRRCRRSFRGGCRRSAALRDVLHDLVQREVEQVRTLARIHQHLGDVRVDLLHGLEVHAVTGDLRRLLVLGEHGAEALGIALRLGDDPRLVGSGFLGEPGSGTDRTGNHVVGIGLGFVLRALALLTSLQHVVERGLYLLGRAHATLLQVNANHFDADLVAVQDGLHEGADAGGDLVALLGQRGIHAHLADDLAHGRLGHLDHGFTGVAAFEQPGPGIVQAVLDGELDLDDVLVLGEHGGLAQAGTLDDAVTADVGGADLGDEHQFVPLDGVRQAPVEAGVDRGLVLAELGDDGLLPFLDDEEAGAQPDQHGHRGDQADAHASVLHVGLESTARSIAGTTAAAVAPAEEASELAVEVTPQFIQVWRLALGIAAAVPPGRWVRTIGIRAVRTISLVIAAAPAGIIQIEHAPDPPGQRCRTPGSERMIHAIDL